MKRHTLGSLRRGFAHVTAPLLAEAYDDGDYEAFCMVVGEEAHAHARLSEFAGATRLRPEITVMLASADWAAIWADALRWIAESHRVNEVLSRYDGDNERADRLLARREAVRARIPAADAAIPAPPAVFTPAMAARPAVLQVAAWLAVVVHGRVGYYEKFRAEAARRGVNAETDPIPGGLGPDFIEYATRHGLLDIAVPPVVEDRAGMTREQFERLVIDDADGSRRDHHLRHPLLAGRWDGALSVLQRNLTAEQGGEKTKGGWPHVPARWFELSRSEFITRVRAGQLVARIEARQVEAARLLRELNDTVWIRSQERQYRDKQVVHDAVAAAARLDYPEVFTVMWAGAAPYVASDGTFGALYRRDGAAIKRQIKAAGAKALALLQERAV